MNSYTLYNEDCLEGMKRLPDGSIDAIITDPPYGITACKWDIAPDLPAMWAQLWRVLKRNGVIVVFCNFKFGVQLYTSCPNPKWYRYDLIYKKQRCAGFLSANKMPLRQHETMLVFSRGGAVYNPQKTQGKPYYKKERSRCSIYPYPASKWTPTINTGSRYPVSVVELGNHNLNSPHPTAKPVGLLDWLVRTYSNSGEVVLDPFCGSGSCGAACLAAGRRFIGFEKDTEFYHTAAKWLADGCQAALFNADAA